MLYTRYSDWIFIEHKKTRLLSKEFTTKGLATESMEELLELAKQHAPSIVSLLIHLQTQEHLMTTPTSKFLQNGQNSSYASVVLHMCVL